ncbi:hypothetical protein QFC21_004318 [Naganishia friedmannii]|uniref:Uncharacterized protein n=1 Tax=Naganishia friedmannii TaxID=89922 RepID=A0ACC2VIG1_9TREE|nr:hypothetical protein QFC21_004318 [Naganishia friedmannii]
MSGTIHLSFRSVFAIAVLITAFSSLLAASTPLPIPQFFSANAFQCVEGDSTKFYMGDGTKSACAPGTVCHYIPGQTWSPCVDPATVVDADARSQIPAADRATPTSSQLQGDPSASPIHPAGPELPEGTGAPQEGEEDEGCEDDREEARKSEKLEEGLNLGAVENPSSNLPTPSAPLPAAPSTTAQASSTDLLATINVAAAPTSSNATSILVEAPSSVSSTVFPAPGPAATGNTAGSITGGAPGSLTEKRWDNIPHTHGQASINPEHNGATGTCETRWEDIANQEPYYVAIEEKYFGTYHNGADPVYSVCGKIIELTWKDKTTRLKVADKCPGCAGLDRLDLSPAAFNSIFRPDGAQDSTVGEIFGPEVETIANRGPMSWKFVD